MKSFELDKLKLNKINIHLIYGDNEGIKEDIINNFHLKKFDDDVLKYDEQEILNNKDEFVSSLLNKSLFEVDKLIIISRGTDKLVEVFNNVIERRNLDTKIIIKSSVLENNNLILIVSSVFFKSSILELIKLTKLFFLNKGFGILAKSENSLTRFSIWLI